MQFKLKHLLILTVFVVGVTPNNTRSGGEYYAPCEYAQTQYQNEDDNGWNLIAANQYEDQGDEYEGNESSQLMKLLGEQQAQEEPYVIIYEVK
jgi:hypothetical protein